jgi:hypothetical protein
MNIKSNSSLNGDLEIIQKQLNAKYVNIFGVATRCKYNYPQILILNPIKDKIREEIDHTGLANPLWLSCPYLAQKIHDLEQEGYIKKIQSFIGTDRKFKTMMEDAHAHFYFFRKQLFYNVMGKSYPENHIKFFNRGIGGINDVRYVKCMHLHYCHYRIYDKNLIGHMASRLLKNDCSCDNMLCKGFKKEPVD